MLKAESQMMKGHQMYKFTRGTVPATFVHTDESGMTGFKALVPCWYTVLPDGMPVAIHRKYIWFPDAECAGPSDVTGESKLWVVTHPPSGLRVIQGKKQHKNREQVMALAATLVEKTGPKDVAHILLKQTAKHIHLPVYAFTPGHKKMVVVRDKRLPV